MSVHITDKSVHELSVVLLPSFFFFASEIFQEPVCLNHADQLKLTSRLIIWDCTVKTV